MEGLAGIESIDACYEPDINAPIRQEGLRHLVAETNAAIEGAFLGGATEVFVWDGHGFNHGKGLAKGLDPRAKQVSVSARFPQRLEALDERIDALVMIGQHSMAGTPGAFLSHTQALTEITKVTIDGNEHGEMSQFAAYGGHYGVPLVYVSGDDALCAEAHRLFPGVTTTTTKRGIDWLQCEALETPDQVRTKITSDLAQALRNPFPPAWKPELPLSFEVEYADPAHADTQYKVWSSLSWTREVRQLSATRVAWLIDDARNAFMVGPILHPALLPL